MMDRFVALLLLTRVEARVNDLEKYMAMALIV